MGFGDAVKQALGKYATFSGRARRSEYWYFTLFNVIVSFVAGILDAVIGVPATQVLVGLALLLPGLAVSVRRLHDIGRSGWWLLIAFTIIGIILLIVWYCQDSDPGQNQHGSSPKGAPMQEPGYPTTV